MSFISTLESGLRQLNIEMNAVQREQCERFYSLLVEKNKVMNLTTITDEDEVAEKHFLDSLLITQVQILSEVKSVLDLGTGAGFPGIPIKIFYPEIEMTLVDSLNKRIDFLKDVSDKLGLSSINIVHARAEELGQDSNYREQFDLCVSRAVADISVLSEYCIPLVKKGGKFISYKAAGSEDEIAEGNDAIELLGGNVSDVSEKNIPGSDIKRKFVIIDKVNPTPDKYPRRPGVPAKKPL